MELTRHLRDDEATRATGAALAPALTPGMVVHLSGNLGAGKTTLVRGVLHALGHHGRVKSPTYALVELYKLSRLYLHHFDFYRFERSTDWQDAGFRELFDGTGVALVEWPERAGSGLPAPDLRIHLEVEGQGRRIVITALTEAGIRCLKRLDST